MRIDRPASDPCAAPKAPSHSKRRLGVISFAALTALLCSGASSPTACQSSSPSQIGPSTGEIVAAGVGIVTAVAVVATVTVVAVDRSRHTLQGCVLTGSNGVVLRTSDSNVYSLEGDPTLIKVGDRVKFHGSKVKKTKDNAGDQVFRVEKLNKDYGPCPVNVATAAGPTR